MLKLEIYIARTVLGSIALVILMLTGLQVFMLFASQLGSLGTGGYGILAAAKYVLLETPYEVYLFFPMASLLGCLIGLGQMAGHQELVVMRAAGFSIGQITLAVIKIACVLIFLATVSGECLIPKMVHLANQSKQQALSGDHALHTKAGVWLRVQQDMILIGTVESEYKIHDVIQFHFNKNHDLSVTRRIENIVYQTAARRWQASGVHETRLYPDHTSAQQYAEMIWPVALNPAVLGAYKSELDEITLYTLHKHLHSGSETIAPHDLLVYSQRLMQPITTLVMMLLAIPFIFGPLRGSTMGSKLMAGATVGFGFYIINRFLGGASQVYQWPPVLAAVLPTGLFALLGLYMMRRAR